MTAVDAPPDDQAQDCPERRPDKADEDTLDQEDPPDPPALHAHRKEDTDLPRLVADHHGQRPHDIEGRDHADQKHHQPHRQLLELERGEQRAVLDLPVDRAIGVAEDTFELLSRLSGPFRMRQPYFDPRYRTLQAREVLGPLAPHQQVAVVVIDRKSTRLNSSHLVISYAVFCLKKKKKNKI